MLVPIMPNLALKTRDLLTEQGQNRMIFSLTPDQAELVAWIKTNTAPNDPILLEPPSFPGSISEGMSPLGGLERLTGRPFIVNYKFVPVDKADTATWYRRIIARAEFFGGDCQAIKKLNAAVVILQSAQSLTEISDCITPVQTIGRYVIAVPDMPAG